MDLKDMERKIGFFGAPHYGVSIDYSIFERSLPDYKLLASKEIRKIRNNPNKHMIHSSTLIGGKGTLVTPVDTGRKI